MCALTTALFSLLGRGPPINMGRRLPVGCQLGGSQLHSRRLAVAVGVVVAVVVVVVVVVGDVSD